MSKSIGKGCARRRLFYLFTLGALCRRGDGSLETTHSFHASSSKPSSPSAWKEHEAEQHPLRRQQKEPQIRPASAVGKCNSPSSMKSTTSSLPSRGGAGGAASPTGAPVHVQDTEMKKLLKRGQLQATGFDKEKDHEASMDGSGDSPSRFALVRRGLYLLYLFSAAILTALLALVSERFRSPYWYRMITCAISQAGAAFIKWGQWASARPDIFPEEFCSTLAMLHSFAPTHSFAFTKQAIEEAFARPLEEVFEAFDPDPIASGSIAQVHAAVMKGRRVAVKVRHPGVAAQIDIDFRVMKKVASLADMIPALKFLNLGHSMEQFSHTLASQTKLDVEGRHLLLLNHNFRKWRSSLRFPEPLVLSEGVLVESWEEGVIISDFIARYSRWRELEAQGCQMCGQVFGAYTHLRLFIQDTLLLPIKPLVDAWKMDAARKRMEAEKAADVQAEAAAEEAVAGRPVEGQGDAAASLAELKNAKNRRRAPLSVELAHFIVSTGEDLYLKMLLVDNLMHADLHPGNILIHVNRNGRPVLTLVDAGMVAKLSDVERANFIGLLESMGRGDGARAARHVLGFSLTQTCVGEDATAFEQEMREVFALHCRGYNTDVSIGVVLREVLALVRKFHVRVDVNYATLLINLLCLEGMAAALLPSYNILDRAKPLLVPHSNKLLRPFFRRIYPLLLGFKRRGESALFNLLKKTGNVQQPHAPLAIGSGSDDSSTKDSSSFLPADRHAPRIKSPVG